MYKSIEVVKEMFKYHPVDNPDRAIKHDELNNAAQRLAELVFSNISEFDLNLSELLIQDVQRIRMITNTYIVYKDVLEKKEKRKTSYLTTTSESGLIIEE